jgi:hypothetical protein
LKYTILDKDTHKEEATKEKEGKTSKKDRSKESGKDDIFERSEAEKLVRQLCEETKSAIIEYKKMIDIKILELIDEYNRQRLHARSFAETFPLWLLELNEYTHLHTPMAIGEKAMSEYNNGKEELEEHKNKKTVIDVFDLRQRKLLQFTGSTSAEDMPNDFKIAYGALGKYTDLSKSTNPVERVKCVNDAVDAYNNVAGNKSNGLPELDVWPLFCNIAIRFVTSFYKYDIKVWEAYRENLGNFLEHVNETKIEDATFDSANVPTPAQMETRGLHAQNVVAQQIHNLDMRQRSIQILRSQAAEVLEIIDRNIQRTRNIGEQDTADFINYMKETLKGYIEIRDGYIAEDFKNMIKNDSAQMHLESILPLPIIDAGNKKKNQQSGKHIVDVIFDPIIKYCKEVETKQNAKPEAKPDGKETDGTNIKQETAKQEAKAKTSPKVVKTGGKEKKVEKQKKKTKGKKSEMAERVEKLSERTKAILTALNSKECCG